MGQLTTHVLDTASGVPAAEMAYRLERVAAAAPVAPVAPIELARGVTNADGRCAAPLLAAEQMQAGCYELHFAVGDYFRARGVAQSEPPFLDIVTLRFGVADTAAHYHVPLLVSPWCYSTYRGS